jgi:hypothetical protein
MHHDFDHADVIFPDEQAVVERNVVGECSGNPSLHEPNPLGHAGYEKLVGECDDNFFCGHEYWWH